MTTNTIDPGKLKESIQQEIDNLSAENVWDLQHGQEHGFTANEIQMTIDAKNAQIRALKFVLHLINFS